MNIKNIISSFVTLENFMKNPIKSLKNSKEEALAICKNNTLVMYVVTPHLLKKLFLIAAQSKNYNYNPSKVNNSLYDNKLEQNYFENKIPSGKFSMHNKWKPDLNFIKQAATWGIILTYRVKKEELTSFIDYWKAEGCFFYHIQWQQKLARHLEQRRKIDNINKRRDINQTFTPDNVVPDGFRDK